MGQAPDTSGVTDPLSLPERLLLKLAKFSLCSLSASEPGEPGAECSGAPDSLFRFLQAGDLLKHVRAGAKEQSQTPALTPVASLHSRIKFL